MFLCPSSAPVGKKLKAAGDGLSSAVSSCMTKEHQISFKVGWSASVNKIKIVQISTNVKKEGFYQVWMLSMKQHPGQHLFSDAPVSIMVCDKSMPFTSPVWVFGRYSVIVNQNTCKLYTGTPRNNRIFSNDFIVLHWNESQISF